MSETQCKKAVRHAQDNQTDCAHISTTQGIRHLRTRVGDNVEGVVPITILRPTLGGPLRIHNSERKCPAALGIVGAVEVRSRRGWTSGKGERMR